MKFPFRTKFIMIHLILSVEGISNFIIGVSDTFDGTVDGFTPCTSFPGYPKHGDFNNIFSCDTPLPGRYVGIYATYDTANPFTICEIAVHTRNGKVYRCNQPKCNCMERAALCNPISTYIKHIFKPNCDNRTLARAETIVISEQVQSIERS